MKRKTVSGITLTLLLTGMLTLASNIQPAKAFWIIYIRADGSVDPPTAPISTVNNITYTFTDNIDYDEIVVERSNIIVDGNGYMHGKYRGDGNGFYLSGMHNVTIQNVNIVGFDYGVRLSSSSSNTITGNNIRYSDYDGIRLSTSSNNTISGNNITDGYDDNGVTLYKSHCNTITQNTITDFWSCIDLYSSSNNTITGNNIVNQTGGLGAIVELDGDWNTIDNNTISNFTQGIIVEGSHNVVSRNLISDGFDCGILLLVGVENRFLANTISNCDTGLYLVELWGTASHNKVYHNNLINNTEQARDWGSPVNFWDDSYPSGGNYWDDYTGIDVCSGPYQNESGSDGTGDTPYFFEGNQDNYPFMFPTFPWDVNHDGKVRIDDVLFAAMRFGTDEGGPPNSNGYLYDSRADIAPQPDHDGKIRIDDILLVAMHFGEGPW